MSASPHQDLDDLYTDFCQIFLWQHCGLLAQYARWRRQINNRPLACRARFGYSCGAESGEGLKLLGRPVFEGVEYPSQRALARHLVPLVGRNMEYVRETLVRLGSGEAVVEHFARIPSRNMKQRARHDLSCWTGRRGRKGKPVVFEGVEYPSREALARHLALRLGRSARTVRYLLVLLRDDGEAVVRRYQDRRRPTLVAAE